MFKRERDMKSFVVCLCDLLCVLLSYNITYHLPYNDLSEYSILLILIGHIGLFYMSDIFGDFYQRGYLEEAKKVTLYHCYLAITMIVAIFVTNGKFNISRRGISCFIIINMILMYSTHVALKAYRKKVYPDRGNSKKVYLVTTKSRLPGIFERMEEAGAWGGKITAIALVDASCEEPDEYQGVPIVKGFEHYYEYAKYEVVDEAFIYLPSEYVFDLTEVVSEFEMMGVPVSFNINALDLPVESEKRVTWLAGFSVITFSPNIYNYGDIIMKRMLDIVGSLVGLVITGLLGIVLVPLIKLESKGPAIFSQDRVGKNGRIFKFYKFRSMYSDAEERKKELLMQNEMQGLMFKMENDPRVTKVGRFIRRTSLDEFPQFYNVLRGDMSLVGTRPPTLDEYHRYEPYQKRRLSAKPGITGMWQVSGRSDITNFNEVMKLDLQYIDNWSVWMDIKILIKTLRVLARRDGAK